MKTIFIRSTQQGGLAGRKEMIDREHKLSMARQAKLLGFSRGSVYYSTRTVSDGALALMRRIDELHLEYPFAGSRMLQGLLKAEGLQTGRLHVATLMKKMAGNCPAVLHPVQRLLWPAVRCAFRRHLTGSLAIRRPVAAMRWKVFFLWRKASLLWGLYA